MSKIIYKGNTGTGNYEVTADGVLVVYTAHGIKQVLGINSPDYVRTDILDSSKETLDFTLGQCKPIVPSNHGNKSISDKH